VSSGANLHRIAITERIAGEKYDLIAGSYTSGHHPEAIITIANCDTG
jgi:hypothetical protein